MVLLLDSPPLSSHYICHPYSIYIYHLYTMIYSSYRISAFISSFHPIPKNIYLCHTLLAHQRDETGKKAVLFLHGVNNVLSLKLEN